ncbi:MAG TPA: NPCBM/NEW2 domain-containing protein, partial [Verrucomicrobiae bacterium]|nr:NPCBM/NEW2 domain-containing protein [Verrucomicrobiae bacterium]
MKSLCTFALILLATISLSTLSHADEIWLSSLDLAGVEQGWGSPHADKSVEGHELSIAGRKFAHGLGTHATGRIKVIFDGKPERFSAWAGVDDETDGRGSVEFEVDANGTPVWKSGVMRAGDAAKEVNVDLAGVKTLVLKVGDAGDGIGYDHADWADAKFVMLSGKPKIYVRP